MKVPALTQLATRMTQAMHNSEDPFSKVKSLISGMIEKLEKEAEADATEKAFCDKEMAETEAEKAAFDTNSAEMKKGVEGVQLALKVLREYYAKDAAHGSAEGAGSVIISLLEVVESDITKTLASLTSEEESAI